MKGTVNGLLLLSSLIKVCEISILKGKRYRDSIIMPYLKESFKIVGAAFSCTNRQVCAKDFCRQNLAAELYGYRKVGITLH